MKSINYSEISEAVADMCIMASYDLPAEVCEKLVEARDAEESDRARDILDQCVENFTIARTEKAPLCQDTGFALFFVEQGVDCRVTGGMLEDAIQEGCAKGYTEGYLRASIVKDPLFGRKNTGDNTPAIIHVKQVAGDALKIIHAPKGGGSENMSALKMLKPSDGVEGVIDFVVDTVINAGGNPCPPVIVGVGIGGTFEKCALLAKEAIIKPLGEKNSDPQYADLEEKILEKINNSGIGPQGLGGKTTALAVHINQFPCHIASLPVAVNMNCHAARHSEIVL